MAGVKVSIDVRGMKQMIAILSQLSRKMQTRNDLHMRWAILAYNWVQRNFASEGGLVGGWKKLSPNTLAGRRGGSGRVLQDTGQLKNSFMPRWNAQQASVGTDVFYSVFHEKGTQPYIIVPVKKPFLAFRVATEYGMKPLKSGGSIPYAKGGWAFAKLVHHPGLPIRRMLPNQSDPVLMRDLLKAGLEYLKKRTDTEGG